MHPDRMRRMFGKDWKPNLPKNTQSEQSKDDDTVLEIDYPMNNTGLFNGDNEITNNKGE